MTYSKISAWKETEKSEIKSFGGLLYPIIRHDIIDDYKALNNKMKQSYGYLLTLTV